MIVNLVMACLAAAVIVILTAILVRVAITQYREIKGLRREIKELEREEKEIKSALNEEV